MEFAEFTELDVAIDAGVAVVTLNRPDRRNAWNGRMAVEYRWALYHADTPAGCAGRGTHRRRRGLLRRR